MVNSMYLWDILLMEAATRRHDRKGQVLLYIFLIGNVSEVINSIQNGEQYVLMGYSLNGGCHPKT